MPIVKVLCARVIAIPVETVYLLISVETANVKLMKSVMMAILNLGMVAMPLAAPSARFVRALLAVNPMGRSAQMGLNA